MADVDNSFGSLTVYFDNAIVVQVQNPVDNSGKQIFTFRKNQSIDNSMVYEQITLYIPKEWKTENNL